MVKILVRNTGERNTNKKLKEIVVVVKRPLINSKEKLLKTIRSLSKAMQLKLHFEMKHSSVAEQSPYRSVRDAESIAEKDMDMAMFSLFDSIRRRWIGSSLIKSTFDVDPFKLKKIRINPKTGKRLTRKEWRNIENSLDVVLKKLFKQQNDFITKRSVALGKILATMPTEDRFNTPLSSIEKTFVLDNSYRDDYLQNAVDWADMNAAQYITDLTSRSKKGIITTLISAEQNQLSSKDIEQQLFDRFSVMNRDWRRIAETRSEERRVGKECRSRWSPYH